jgi:hypothetical protein
LFCSDNVRKHIAEQHSKRWEEYQALRNNYESTEEDLKLFSRQSAADAFLEKRSTVIGRKRVFAIDMSIFDGIVKVFLNPPKSDDEAKPGAVPRADSGTNVFEPEYVIENDGSKTMSCYRVTINNALQFDYVVSLLAAGLTFRQISRVVRENRERLGCASKAGCVSDGEASSFSGIVCAVGLQILSDLISRSRAFAVSSEVSIDAFGQSHLDVRLRFPGVEVGDDLLSFHLLAISLFNEQHTGASLFNIFFKVFASLSPVWRDKLIGSSTDGAPNMTGCNVGFTTLLANAVSSPVFHRVWCLDHQLYLAIKAATNAIHDEGGFPFINIMTTAIGWLRRQETLIRTMGSKCPYYINVRWTSLSKVLKWMLANRCMLCDYFASKTFASAPPLDWWLIAKVVNHFLLTVNITFEALHVESSVFSKRDENFSLDVSFATSSDSMSKGQFKVTFDGIQHLLQGIDVEAAEL